MSRFTRLALDEVFKFAESLSTASNAIIHRSLFSRTTVARHPELFPYGHNIRRWDSRRADPNWKYRTRWSIYAGLYQTVFGDGPNGQPIWLDLMNQETRNWGAKRSRRDGMTGIDRMFQGIRASVRRTALAGWAASRPRLPEQPNVPGQRPLSPVTNLS